MKVDLHVCNFLLCLLEKLGGRQICKFCKSRIRKIAVLRLLTFRKCSTLRSCDLRTKYFVEICGFVSCGFVICGPKLLKTVLRHGCAVFCGNLRIIHENLQICSFRTSTPKNFRISVSEKSPRI